MAANHQWWWLGWLPVMRMIKHHCSCAIHRYYSHPDCMLLDPPFVFGLQHRYHTRTLERFVYLNCCRLLPTQRSFRHAAAELRNDLSDDLAMSSTFSSDIYEHFLNSNWFVYFNTVYCTVCLFILYLYSCVYVYVGCSYVYVVILYLLVHVCLVFVCSDEEEQLQSEHQSLNE